MGVLDAVTGRETARYRTPDGVEGSLVAEPLTNYFAGRLRREGRAGQTAVGGFLGAVDRGDLEGDLSGLLRKSAYTGGIESRDLDSLFGARPDNIFLVKVSYWLNP